MRRSILLKIAAVAMLAGCGPTSVADQPAGDANPPANSGGAATAARNPCELLSPSDMATIVSNVDKLAAPPTITQAGPVGEFQGRKCTWSYPRKEVVTDTAEVAVTAWRGTQYYTPDAVGGFTAVPGIGDAAHVGPGMFMFRVKTDVFLVAVTGDANLEALRPAIAKALVAKL